MKTIFFLSAASFLIIFFASDSFGISHRNPFSIPQAHMPAQQNVPDQQQPHQQFDWVVNWSLDNGTTDHEKETHNFHYDRLSIRRRFVLVFIVKLLLLVVHACIIICTSLHMLH